jgi:hypothetical membrane protein
MSEVESQQNRMIRYLAAAGIFGPVLYTVTWLVLGFLDPTYSHTRDPISNLSAIGAPYALVMTSIILVFALLIVVFAYGLHRGLPSGFWAGPATLAIAGVGYAGIALAPLNLAGLGDPNVPHTISASVTVFAMMLAPLFLYPRLRRNPGWKNLSGYSIATTILALAFAILASLPTFAGWEGLMQRLVLSVVLVWMIAIAIRLYARPRP